jgi:RNA polymerase sigma factor (sigma-70 family)
MKKRQLPGVERLEARETPDVSLGMTAACSFVPLPANQGILTPTPGELANSLQQTEKASASALGLGSPASSAGLFSPAALDTFFADSGNLEQLLAEDPGLFSDAGKSLRPSRTARPQESDLQGLHFLCHYTRKAIRNDEARFGTLPDHDDVVHQVFVDWWEQVGPGQQVFDTLLQKDSLARTVLRKTVRRVLDHLRYEQNRGKRTVELFDIPAPDQGREHEWIDLQLDWAQGGVGPGPRAKQILDLRRQGMTFEEIGSEMGLLKQRVCELYNAAVEQLQELYAE